METNRSGISIGHLFSTWATKFNKYRINLNSSSCKCTVSHLFQLIFVLLLLLFSTGVYVCVTVFRYENVNCVCMFACLQWKMHILHKINSYNSIWIIELTIFSSSNFTKRLFFNVCIFLWHFPQRPASEWMTNECHILKMRMQQIKCKNTLSISTFKLLLLDIWHTITLFCFISQLNVSNMLNDILFVWTIPEKSDFWQRLDFSIFCLCFLLLSIIFKIGPWTCERKMCIICARALLNTHTHTHTYSWTIFSHSIFLYKHFELKSNNAYILYIHILYPPKDNCSKCRHSLLNEWFVAFLFSVWLMEWASTALSFVCICILLSFCFPKLFTFAITPSHIRRSVVCLCVYVFADLELCQKLT